MNIFQHSIAMLCASLCAFVCGLPATLHRGPGQPLRSMASKLRMPSRPIVWPI